MLLASRFPTTNRHLAATHPESGPHLATVCSGANVVDQPADVHRQFADPIRAQTAMPSASPARSRPSVEGSTNWIAPLVNVEPMYSSMSEVRPT